MVFLLAISQGKLDRSSSLTRCSTYSLYNYCRCLLSRCYHWHPGYGEVRCTCSWAQIFILSYSCFAVAIREVESPVIYNHYNEISWLRNPETFWSYIARPAFNRRILNSGKTFHKPGDTSSVQSSDKPSPPTPPHNGSPLLYQLSHIMSVSHSSVSQYIWFHINGPTCFLPYVFLCRWPVSA